MQTALRLPRVTEMLYRRFGKSSVHLSALGLGTMRLPDEEDEAISIIHKALDLGINYLDTAPAYRNMEITLGRALASRGGGEFFISTKNPIEDDTARGWRERLERSLQRLGVQLIHFYQVAHGLNWKLFEENLSKSGALGEALRAKGEGLIGHICFSFHDSPESLIRLIDTGLFEGVTVQYNFLDRSCEDAISYAHERGMGVVVMGPVAGGRLVSPSENIRQAMRGDDLDTPRMALRFVLSHPGVTCALSGMTSIAMLERNCAAASEAAPLTGADWQQIRDAADHLKQLAELYCTGCRYCMPCPNDVNIAECFHLMNLHRVWGQTEAARRRYSRIGAEGSRLKGQPASLCVECGECEPKCPQHIPIIEQLKATAAVMEG